MDRHVNFVSGLPRSGKSTLLESVHLQFPDSSLVSMDTIGKKLYGPRQSMKEGSSTTELTQTEKRYRNEYTFDEIKRQLIADNAQRILAEAPLLTRRYHQDPLVQRMNSAEEYISAIEREKSVIVNSRVHLNAVLLFTSLDKTTERVVRARAERKGDSDTYDIAIYLGAAKDFDFPIQYPYLLIETTDESEQAQKNRIDEAVSFFRGEMSHRDIARLNYERMSVAVRYLEEAITSHH